MAAGDMKECLIYWIHGENTVSIMTPHNTKFGNKIAKLAKKFPDEVQIEAQNDDGVIFAHFPLKYLKIHPPRILSEEQKEIRSQRMKRIWKEKDKTV